MKEEESTRLARPVHSIRSNVAAVAGVVEIVDAKTVAEVKEYQYRRRHDLNSEIPLVAKTLFVQLFFVFHASSVGELNERTNEKEMETQLGDAAIKCVFRAGNYATISLTAFWLGGPLIFRA